MSRVALILSLLVCFGPLSKVAAQKKPPTTVSSLCTRDYAIDTSKQQIIVSRTLDNAVQRIAVLLRTADLLWPHEQDKALAAFTEAFDLAVQNFKEHGDQTRRASEKRFSATIALPDQRFKVITALAKYDPARAQKWSEQMLQETVQDPAAAPQDKTRTAEKLLQVANHLVTTDPMAALSFARQSLRYPASMFLTLFLYELSKANKQLADRFYTDALAAYAKTPMVQFLYLSAYPFGNSRDAGEMPTFTRYQIPEGYVPSPALQQAFMQVLLARVEGVLGTKVEITSSHYPEDHLQMWYALTRLEKQVQAELPDLADATVRSTEKLLAVLGRGLQEQLTGRIEADNKPREPFDVRVEAAEKSSNVERRDEMLVSAIIGASSKEESVDKVLSVIDKISDSNIRGPLLNWFYSFRAQAMISEKNLSEARRFASKVTELDQRAYLFTRIAEESLKVTEDQTEARELLNEIAESVSKAPKTIVSARALLALAHLYAKFDMIRGIEELGNAVRIINTLEAPDFSQEVVLMKIEGRKFGRYAEFSTPGFNPENAFREMGKLDFDGSMVQATLFTDKSLRALTTLAVIEPCFATKSTKNK
ncbi:MAG TPA: hypothetical protein VJ751_10300 [Pyrinomonadaceae bacterium]|nr:hypothetical protein [Pyrinomonadaceae bacterium]